VWERGCKNMVTQGAKIVNTALSVLEEKISVRYY